MIINISGDISLMDANDAASYVQDLTGEDANIIFGAKFDESVQDAATITVIATGLESPAESPSVMSGLGSRLGGSTSSLNLSRTTSAPGKTVSTAQPIQNINSVQRPKNPTPSVPQKDIKIPDFLKSTRR